MVYHKRQSILTSIYRLACYPWALCVVFPTPRYLLSPVVESRYGDDCLLAATRGIKLLELVSVELKKSYSLTTSIEPTNFVGLAISHDRQHKSITISQPHFAGKLIDLYSVPSSTAKYSMAEDFLTSSKSASDLPILSLPLQTLFQEKVGYILYLASHSRPDLLYSTTQLSRRSNKATSKGMAAADRLLRYIASTSDLGLTFCQCRLILRLLF